MTTIAAKVVKFQLQPHPNADTLSIASIEGTGWQCIVKTEQFQNKNSTGIYIPIDAEVDTSVEAFTFLNDKAKNSKFRIRTIKLRGIVSQGLLIPNLFNGEVGQDFTSVLQVTRWEPEVPPQFAGDSIKCPELFWKYSSIENFKNYPNVLQTTDQVRVTEKIHGTNARFGLVMDNGAITYCVGSHNTNKKLDGKTVYNKISSSLDIENKLKTSNLSFASNLIVFGEIYGEGIQDLRYDAQKGLKFRIFDVLIDNTYQPWTVIETVANLLQVETVPVMYRGSFDLSTIQSLLNGETLLGGSNIREGVVVTTEPESWNPEIGRKIIKFISDDFLLRKGAKDGH